MTVELPGYRVVDSPRDGRRGRPAQRRRGLPRLDRARPAATWPVRVAGRQAYAAVFGGPGTGTVPAGGGGLLRQRRARSPGWCAPDVAAGPRDGDAGARRGRRRRRLDRRRAAADGASRHAAAAAADQPGRVGRRHARCGSSTARYGPHGRPELDLAVDGARHAPRSGAPAWPPTSCSTRSTSTGLVTARLRRPGRSPGRPDDTSGPAQLTLDGRARRRRRAGDGRARAARRRWRCRRRSRRSRMVCVPDLAELLPAGRRRTTCCPSWRRRPPPAQDRLVVVSVPATDAAGLCRVVRPARAGARRSGASAGRWRPYFP